MSATPRTVVVKVGGSLLDWDAFPARLSAHLETLRTHRRVLVVGGGKAADFVRVLDSTHRIGENRAHRLALWSLELTARVAAALVPGLVVVERLDELPRVWDSRPDLVPVLAPRRFLEEVDRHSDRPLAESWDVTSDSIAARLAHHLRADELRLLKSTGGGKRVRTRAEAAALGWVDPAFPAASAPLDRVTLVNLRADSPSVDVIDRH